MLLHFIFVIKEEDLRRRRPEFKYVQDMAKFYQSWIRAKFGRDYAVKCDELVTRPRGILGRLDTHTMVRDHEMRGTDSFHFYLCHFKPLWTDCTCEGYHAENFGMVWWQQPEDPRDTLFLAERNCTVVSHEIAHEMLRLAGRKRFIQDVHDVWTRHFYSQLEFEQYGDDHKETDGKPTFLTINTSGLGL